MTKNLGMTLLAAYLILTGLRLLFGLSFVFIGVIEGLLALAAGVLLLARR